MEPKKIWLSAGSGPKNRYALRLLGSVAGIAVLAVVLVGGGTVLCYRLGWPREVFLLALCLGVTALAVGLALAAGRRAARDATVFFLTGDDRLYAVDARRLSYHGDGDPVRFARGTLQTQAFLRRLAAQPGIPQGADEILRVENLKQNAASCAVVCEARHPNGRTVRRTYFLYKGLPDGDLLLRELERRQTWQSDLEPAADHGALYILLSAVALAALGAVCVLSHPAVARLPQALYFPCLGAAFAALWALVYFVVRRRRGE